MSTLTLPEKLAMAKACEPLNALELELSRCGPAPKCELRHTFTPGLYGRQITMPKGFICTSKIHKTTHQFTVSKGLLKIWTEAEDWVLIQSPYSGITMAG